MSKELKMKNGSMKRRFGILVLFTALFLFPPATSQSYPDLPNDNLAYPVLLVTKAGISGSGFFYNKDDGTYLITARHVLFKETSVHVPQQFVVPTLLRHKFDWQEDKVKKEWLLNFYGVMSESERDDLIKAAPKSDRFDFNKGIEQLYKESQQLRLKSNEITLYSYAPKVSGRTGVNEIEVQLTNLFKSGRVKYHPSQDVALIRIGNRRKVAGEDQIVFLEGLTKKQGTGLLGVGKDNVKLFKEIIVGNPVFVFGYPTSITGINPWLDIKLPLLRKGIIAGKNEVLRAIILDCPVFQGNSGGLAIEVETTSLTEIKYKAIGLITNLVPYQTNWIQNSGYSIVVPMDFVEELITGQTK